MALLTYVQKLAYQEYWITSLIGAPQLSMPEMVKKPYFSIYGKHFVKQSSL